MRGVVVDAPCLDHDASLGEGVEDLSVEQLVAELRVEALAEAVPRATWFDERRLRSHRVDPVPHGRGDGLGAIACREPSLPDRVLEARSREGTWFGRSGRRRMHDPSFSQSRPFLVASVALSAPSGKRPTRAFPDPPKSRRHIRSTRFTFTAQPASREPWPRSGDSPSRDLASQDPAGQRIAPILAGERDDVRGQRVFIGPAAWHLALR